MAAFKQWVGLFFGGLARCFLGKGRAAWWTAVLLACAATGAGGLVPDSVSEALRTETGNFRRARAPAKRPVPAKGGERPPQPVPAQWAQVTEAAVKLLAGNHYSEPSMDRALSRKAFDRYLEVLDPSRLFFLEHDVEGLRETFAAEFVEQLKAGSFQAVEAVEKVRSHRLGERARWLETLLAGVWDFTKPWEVEDSREHAAWAPDAEQAQRIWREQIGAEILVERLEGGELEQALERVRHRYRELGEAASRGLPEKAGAALMGLARALDAHSDYLSQEEFESNEGELHLTRVGIGVTLDKDPSGLRVVGILPGGPAHKDGRLRVNDRIVAVADEGKPFRELAELPFEERVRLLRGKRGALVRLRLAARPVAEPAAALVVNLRRQEMRSREGEAYAKWIELPGRDAGKIRVGWIVVPAFYGEEADGRGVRSSSVARDVAALLKRLKAERVTGVVLDLRGNAGGLLDEAVELGGLFCGRVAIAAVRAPQQRVEVLLPETLRKPLYEGPLTVLVDGESASASELLAAALQDHRRAVVVGGEKTFGKGTVQATFPLGEYLHSKFRAPVGGLLVTLGKFYRVSGQSTQLSGVRPDVILPSTLDVPGRGESSLGFPLPHDSIPPVWGPVAGAVSSEMLQELRLRSERRREGSVLFKCIARGRERLKKEWEHNRVSLLEAERRAEREGEQKEYAYWQSLMRGAPEGSVYAKLRLEDLKLKVLERSAGDEFRSTDPEWVATEEETLAIMEDLIRLWK